MSQDNNKDKNSKKTCGGKFKTAAENTPRGEPERKRCCGQGCHTQKKNDGPKTNG